MEIFGKEFDWFAIDTKGNVALFASAGSGVVPQEVLPSAESHAAVADSIEVSGWGSAAVWGSYSRVGIYAYDWSPERSTYLRVAIPKGDVDSSLLSSVRAIPSIPRVPGDFSEADAILPGEGG